MANKPKKTFRAGTCSASVFLNDRQTSEGTVSLPSVSFSCRYLDDATGEWKDTKSLSPGEVAKALVVLQQALNYCWVELEPKRRQAEKK